jgi:DNA-binding transcriptional MerR regulator
MQWLHEMPPPPKLGLPNVPVNILLLVLQGLRYAAQRAGNDWHFHHTLANLPTPNLDIVERRRLTLAERSNLYCTAFRGLLDWPYGFYAFLDAYRTRSHDMGDKGLRREFGSLYMSWLMRFWRHPAFAFVSQCFNTYVVEHLPAAQVVNAKWVTYHPEILERFDYGNAPYVAQELGISVAGVHRLAQAGALTAYHFGRYERTPLYSRRQVEHLKQRWQRHRTRVQASQQLGISLEIISEMLKAGVLQAVSPSEGTELGDIIYISQDNLDALLHLLRQHTRVQAQMPSDGVCIAEASKLCSAAVGQNYAHLLQRIMQGKLMAYHTDPTILPLGKIWFSWEDVTALPQVLKEERGWLSLTETLQHMDVKRGTLQHFFDSELLTPVAGSRHKRFFSRDQVFDLKARMVSSREAADLLQLPMHTISLLAGGGVLLPLSGPGINQHGHYVFDRGDLLEWQEKHITLAEIRAIIADPDLRRQIRQQVNPLFSKPYIYPRKEVMSVVNLND